MTTRASFQFFFNHAGYSVPPGRAVCALALARAEFLLSEAREADVVRVEWHDDDYPYDHDGFTHEEIEEKFSSNEWSGPYACLMYIDGEIAASLSGIVVGPRSIDDPYCRVVEAELADEIADDIRQALGDYRDSILPPDRCTCLPA